MCKIRIKFRKYGVMKFVGHLDIMRYFQKAMRRAEIPIAFSKGYSPHMIMSFANPLGVGLTGDGEYLDIELTEVISSNQGVTRLNEVMVEGMEILSFVQLPEGQKTGMSIVIAADYRVHALYQGFSNDFKEQFPIFVAEKEVLILKQTKKSEREVDIRPLIYDIKFEQNDIFLKLATGSVENLKPALVMKSILSYMGIDSETMKFVYHRLEVYADGGNGRNNFVSLEDLGTEITNV